MSKVFIVYTQDCLDECVSQRLDNPGYGLAVGYLYLYTLDNPKYTKLLSL
jgi:hypothetical protein